MAEELKACPFCGQSDFLIEQLDGCSSVVICQGMVDEHSACLARGPIAIQDDDGEEQPGKHAAIREWNTRAQQSSQGGEAVNVVGIRISTDGFGSYIADSTMGIGPTFPGEVREPLMTVAQHNRIMAAATPADSRVVPVELLERAVKHLSEGRVDGPAAHELRALLEVKP